MKQFLHFLLTVFSVSFLFISCQTNKEYRDERGDVFGTYYHLVYDCDSDLSAKIHEKFDEIDRSVDIFNPTSIVSRINNNEDVVTDEHFETIYREAENVSSITNGAFDITVAPLVNMWGFGFKHKEEVTQEKIDSVLELVNFLNINLNDHHLYKRDVRTMLDFSAIAKGYACDVIAKLFDDNNCKNYVVEIGGELVVRGVNAKGKPWKLGITKPIDDPTGENAEIHEIIVANDAVSMATSGNYRNYYYDNLTRRSHTIDPRTGYPVQHKLLSATVFASNCTRADALATTCMVMGEEEALGLIESLPDAGCYFIITGDKSEYEIIKSSKWIDKYDKHK